MPHPSHLAQQHDGAARFGRLPGFFLGFDGGHLFRVPQAVCCHGALVGTEGVRIYRYVCMCVYVYIYIYREEREREREKFIYLSIHLSVYTYIYICTCTFTLIFTYTHRILYVDRWVHV